MTRRVALPPTIAIRLAVATLSALAVLSLADAALADAEASSGAPNVPICIRAYDIDHTEVPNDKTILFYMRSDHAVWKNTLIDRCVGLKNSMRGFTYSPTDPGTDEICANLLTIHVNDTGETCLLGDFTKLPPKTPGTALHGS